MNGFSFNSASGVYALRHFVTNPAITKHCSLGIAYTDQTIYILLLGKTTFQNIHSYRVLFSIMSVLITGASGYLGGSLLAQLHNTVLPEHKEIYALVRSQDQAEAVKKYGARPLIFASQDENSVIKSIVDAQIFVIYFLVDAMNSDMQIPMIKVLAEVKKQTGREVHFLHTSGAKIFSEHAGMPIDRTLPDTDPRMYDLQKSSHAPHQLLAQVSSQAIGEYKMDNLIV